MFVSTDFTDITDKKTVNMGLIRLADEGLYRLRRCAHICRLLAEHSEPLFGRGYQRRGILDPLGEFTSVRNEILHGMPRGTYG